MAQIADKFISKGGRTANYGRSEFTNDLLTAANFLAWAEHDGAYFGGHSAKDAFKAVCRLIDMDSVALRKIALGEG